jgi:hypothetical protein
MSGLLKVLKVILTLFAKGAKSSPIVASEKKEIPLESPKFTPPSQTINKPQILFKNDSERLKEEFNELAIKNVYLSRLIVDAQNYCYTNFQKNIVITMIYRTQEEQDSIYKDDARYKVKKFKSPHQFFHASDLRSSTFTPEEIKKLVDYLNLTYDENNYYKFTAMCHDVGLGEHFHIQFAKK